MQQYRSGSTVLSFPPPLPNSSILRTIASIYECMEICVTVDAKRMFACGCTCCSIASVPHRAENNNVHTKHNTGAPIQIHIIRMDIIYKKRLSDSNYVSSFDLFAHRLHNN